MKTSVRPSRLAFFYPRPVLSGPLGNRLLVAFTGATLGLLGTPAQAPQEMPDARGTIGDAKVPFNNRRDARQRPEFIAEAMGTSPLAQEGDEALALVETEFGLTPTGMELGVEPRLSMPRHGIAPAPDGTGGGLDVSGDLPDAPAGFQQCNGDSASDFELDSCALRSHETLIGRIDLGL